jgi:hypothetical protein
MSRKYRQAVIDSHPIQYRAPLQRLQAAALFTAWKVWFSPADRDLLRAKIIIRFFVFIKVF